LSLPALPARAAIVLAVLTAMASEAFCQSPMTKALKETLATKTTEARFASLAIDEAGKLASVDEAQWLLGELAKVAVQAVDRKTLLVGRASLLELAGNYREAAASWEDAARSIPGLADARILLSAAACMLAAGEADAASGLATAISFSSPDPSTAKLAKLISGWSALASGDAATALANATVAMEDADNRVAVSALILARAATEGTAREGYDRLLSKRFPSRPEAGATAPLALFLMAGSVAAGPPLAETPAAIVKEASGNTVFFQVGAFRDEANAQALKAKLERLGLEAHARRRTSADLFLVYVNAGQDAQATVLKLKDAGYESWMMDEAP